MQEIVPGIVHWTARHPNIGRDVSSYFVVRAGALIDPMEPEDGVGAVTEHGEPRVVLLTNRHHLRGGPAFREAFGVPILCQRNGMLEFADGVVVVEPYSWGYELAPGITALKVAAICDEETALLVEGVEGNALAVADGVVHYGEQLSFVPDELLGDDAEKVKEGLREAYAQIAEEHEFEHLLPAHGDPVVGGARDALRRFAED